MIQPILSQDSIGFFWIDEIPKAVERISNLAYSILNNFYYFIPALAFAYGYKSDLIFFSLVCTLDAVNWLLDDTTVRDISCGAFAVAAIGNLALGILRANPVGVVLEAITVAKVFLIKNERRFDVQ